VIVLKDGTKLRLERTARTLLDEFAHLRGEDVTSAFAAETRRLIAGARFDDYVPILAYRSTRDRLRAQPRPSNYSQAA